MQPTETVFLADTADSGRIEFPGRIPPERNPAEMNPVERNPGVLPEPVDAVLRIFLGGIQAAARSR
ncbi:hypothetical protein [Streptomyces sp. NBC_00094]|uniref:hypothetical protein n=1 Tax=Streptomyces sp. NBC_00094 TaxID=2903620 RepID=UPI002253D86F|nr:hypothetical protein [Streptomyces sp. NBC_00094]MCX5390516.1 hypothetical protein [Streptomyces sp. NBC_00094]